jgi:hypothetical protein
LKASLSKLDTKAEIPFQGFKGLKALFSKLDPKAKLSNQSFFFSM